MNHITSTNPCSPSKTAGIFSENPESQQSLSFQKPITPSRRPGSKNASPQYASRTRGSPVVSCDDASPRRPITKKKLCLEIPTRIDPKNDVAAILRTSISSTSPLNDVSTDTPFRDLCAAVRNECRSGGSHHSDVVVERGYGLIDDRDKRVSKFTLVPVANGRQLALFVSISHVVADGYTYYKIINFLERRDERTIERLNPRRKMDFGESCAAAIGKEEYDLLSSPGIVFNVVGTTLRQLCARCCCCCGGGHRPVKFDARFVDRDKIAREKQNAAKRAAAVDNNPDVVVDHRQSPPPPPTFTCSTNDILTSSFGKATKSRLLLMAINLRQRVRGVGDADAGNYETCVIYDPPGYARPELVRQSFQPPLFRRVGGALPSFFELARCRLAMITSWAFPAFEANLKMVRRLGSTSGRREETTEEEEVSMDIHLPVFSDTDYLPFPVAIVFKPRFGELAVLYCNADNINFGGGGGDGVVDDVAPLGDRVDARMFGDD
mmetsp:Transcript_9541/g.11796  ORF Transcript_9541/g.11796 Transcript_9541/m.11796 type:complete len:493 (-) Transcript_9541:422-1900(-)